MGALTDPNDIPRPVVPLCWTCKHWLTGQRCKAFSGRVPTEITTGKFDHRNPHPLDNGLQYEEAPDVAKAPIAKATTIRV